MGVCSSVWPMETFKDEKIHERGTLPIAIMESQIHTEISALVAS